MKIIFLNYSKSCSNYAPSSTPTTLTYTVKKCQDDICRLRLDYDLFVLTTPNTADAKTGQCDTDKMSVRGALVIFKLLNPVIIQIKTTGQTVVPGTGTTGTYGNYPQLCGTNTGYHCTLLTSTHAGCPTKIIHNLFLKE